MKVFLLAILFLVLAVPAQAQRSGYTCGLYFADSEYAPPEARELLKPDSDAALRTCSIAGDPKTRYLEYVSAPLSGAFNVCQIVESRLYKHDVGWFRHPRSGEPYYGDPRVLMMLAEEACPRRSDKRYTLTNEVSQGVFAVVARFWKELSSADGQDALFAKVASDLRSGTTFQEFESAIRGGETFELVNVALDPASAHHPRHYTLYLEGKPENRILEVDVTGDTVIVLGIGTFIH